MAVAEWFFLRGRHENGPFTLAQIHSPFSSGTITEETYLWRPGLTNWEPLSAFAEFAGLQPQPHDHSQAYRQRRNEPLVAPRRQAIVPDEPPALIQARQWVDTAPHPWRRYFARYLDYLLWSMALLFLLSIGLASVNAPMFLRLVSLMEGTGGGPIAMVLGNILVLVLGIVLALIPNAVLIGLTGGNLGKWLFGICVLSETDRPIGIIQAFKREGRVLFYGLGLGVPIVSLVTMILAYQKLKKDGATSWDQALAVKVVHRKNGVAQYIGFAVGLILLIGLFGVLVRLNMGAQSF
ncbi:MAG TPA: RDD family protein [Nordella sp.]|nr:RDD family protein [Nordella sp.]